MHLRLPNGYRLLHNPLQFKSIKYFSWHKTELLYVTITLPNLKFKKEIRMNLIGGRKGGKGWRCPRNVTLAHTGVSLYGYKSLIKGYSYFAILASLAVERS